MAKYRSLSTYILILFYITLLPDFESYLSDRTRLTPDIIICIYSSLLTGYLPPFMHSYSIIICTHYNLSFVISFRSIKACFRLQLLIFHELMTRGNKIKEWSLPFGGVNKTERDKSRTHKQNLFDQNKASSTWYSHDQIHPPMLF